MITIKGKSNKEEALEKAKKSLLEIAIDDTLEAVAKKPILQDDWFDYIPDPTYTYWGSATSSASDIYWSPTKYELHVDGKIVPANDELKVQLQKGPYVVISPASDGPFVRIGVEVAFATDMFETFKGCTGEACDMIMGQIKKSLMEQLIEWHKSKHEGGVWPNEAEAVDSSPT